MRHIHRSIPVLATFAGSLLLVGSANAATSLTIGAAPAHVVAGAPTVLSGAATPAVAGEQLVVAVQGADGTFSRVATVTTAANGTWSRKLVPPANATYRVQSLDATVASAPVSIGVAPRLQLSVKAGATAFGPATITASVLPRTFTGAVRVQIDGAGTKVATTIIPIRKGVGRKVVTVQGAGRFRLRGTTAGAGFEAARATIGTTVKGRTLRAGMSGPDVRGLQVRLRQLGFLTPGTGARYSFATSEVTLAFQKYYELPRTYVWGKREWAKLASLEHGPTPAFSHGSAAHIEVDKSRQTLLVAKGAKVLGVIAVSTGATGNTPVGNFRIYQRGGSYLYRFMAFHGNFGIHGYNPVPAHPASHGCVREPNWAATFVWNNTKLGSPVHVYR